MSLPATLATVIVLSCLSWGQSASAPASPEPTAPAATAAASNATDVSSPTSGDSTRLIIVKYRKPDYPIAAQNQQIQGRVVIHLVITEAGDVESAEAVSGNHMLADSAIQAMKTWKFKPYIKDGHPVRVSTQMNYDFAFKEQVKDLPQAPAIPAGPADRSASTAPVQIAPGISQGMLVHRVSPIYPRDARTNHVQGIVLLHAIIGKDGNITNLQVISGPPELTDAAVAAVQQWRYKPYYLNGEPVAVQTTIKVNFTLSGL